MENLLRNIIMSMICAFGAYLFSSCGSRHADEDDALQFPDQKKCILSINIATIATRDAESSVREQINSFRIIIIGNDTVELNKKITTNTNASVFNYFLTWPTSAGEKKFYLFANEENVTDLQFEGNPIPPGLTQPIALESLLDTYKEGDVVTDFPELICFTPEYEIDDNGIVTLPYSSVYDINVINSAQDLDMYLVPAATKFTFNFYNYRLTSYPIILEGLSINEVNPMTYLFGRVGNEDKYKIVTGEKEPSYWVDWLAKVSKLSQNETGFSGNVNFNEKYGWIKYYSVPETNNDTQTHFFFAATGASGSTPPVNPIYIYGGKEDETDEETVEPYFVSLGPYYIPESKNILDVETGGDLTAPKQAYYLTINWKETEEDKEMPEFTNVEISNLPALFRNTNVIINIRLRQGDVEIYGEVADWSYKSKKGWATEGSAPNL